MSAGDADDKKKDKAMPFGKDDDKDEDKKAAGAAGAAGTDSSEDDDSLDPDISEDTGETGGLGTLPPPEPKPDKTDDGEVDAKDADAAQAMMELEHHLSDMGIEFHGSAHDTLLNFVQHLNTAIATHKSTKAGGVDTPKPGAEDPNQQDQNQTNNPQNPQEPEVAESAPIMMSATTKSTAREIALAKKLVKSSNDNLRARIVGLHVSGYIDDGIKKELLDELGTIKLSMSDLTDAGDLKPTTVSIRVDAYERLAKTKKPGSFVKPRAEKNPTNAGGRPNPLKPISSAVALSAGDGEDIVEPPDGGEDPNQDRPVNRDIVNRLSGGKYDNYLAERNGTQH